MMVVCLISVLVKFGSIPFFSNTNVTGIVKSESKENYLVDFSIETDSKKYIGDYSKIVVSKSKCVDLMKAKVK